VAIYSPSLNRAEREGSILKLTFLGANRNVTGSRYCLEVAKTRLMIDCGMVQEREFLARNWEPCPVPAESVDAIALTHAHVDHIGLIPKFVKDGFRGPIFATKPTVDLAGLMLTDAARIQEEDAKYKKRRHRKEGRKGPRPEVPLFTENDAHNALKLFRGVDYDSPTRIGEGVNVTWQDAGHILGSASLEVSAAEKNLERTFVFSGDIGQQGKPLIGDPTLFERADYVVMESTYGDRDHVQQEGIEEQLEHIANETLSRGGNLVIPVFAVERAQEMMYFLSRLVHGNRIADVPIFLDSPMAYDATEIFRKYEHWLDAETRTLIEADEPPLHFPGLKLVRTTEQSKAINVIDTPCIIMAPAGMCQAGRIKHHLKANVGRADSTILFVGFQARGTLGRRLLSGEREVRIHGRQYQVSAQIEQMFGLSGHADRTGLLTWLGHFKRQPRKVFLTHGEEDAALSFQQTVHEKLGFEVSVPEFGEVFEIEDDGPSFVDRSGHQASSAVHCEVGKPRQDVGGNRQGETQLNVEATQSGLANLEHPDLEFLDAAKRRPVTFLHEDPWRVMRIQSDTMQGIEVMSRALQGRRRAVAVFGSARLPASDPAYQHARETCRLLGERGFAIITGGGPGIMEAANRGARDAASLSIGLNIKLPHEQALNPYCDASYTCHYFFVRKMMFAKYSRGFLIFPGGFGTLDELFESLTLIQTGKLAEFPVVLAGTEYWKPVIDWMKSTVLEKGCIDEEDIGRFRVLDEPSEIAAWLDETIDGQV